MDQRPQHKTKHTHRRESRSTLKHIGTENHFLNITTIAQTLRAIINKWDLMKLRNILKQRTKSKRQNDRLQNGKFITIPTSDKRLISKECKELEKLYIKRPNDELKGGVLF